MQWLTLSIRSVRIPLLFEYLQVEGKKEVDSITWEKVGLRILALYENVLKNYGK